MATLVALVLSCLLVLAAVMEAAGSGIQCCMADQISVRMVQTYVTNDNGHYELGEVYSDLQYDAVNQVEMFRTSRSDNLGEMKNFTYYFSYNTSTMYTYDASAKKCTQYPYTRPFTKRCVPASATLMDRIVYGAGSDAETIKASRVQFTIPRGDSTPLQSMLTVTPDCVPILEEFLTLDEATSRMMSETIEFNNFVQTNQAAPPLPACCVNAPTQKPQTYPNLYFG